MEIGDIVVVLREIKGNFAQEGVIGELTDKDSSHTPYRVMTPSGNSWCNNARPATPDEVAAYKKGITNMKDVQYKPLYIIY